MTRRDIRKSRMEIMRRIVAHVGLDPEQFDPPAGTPGIEVEVNLLGSMADGISVYVDVLTYDARGSVSIDRQRHVITDEGLVQSISSAFH